MMKKIFLVVASLYCWIFFTTELQAQDIHFTQFAEPQLLLNPANTGAPKGQYRFILNSRGQWYSSWVNANKYAVQNSGYLTFAASADMSVKAGKKSMDMVGFGMQITNDRAGEVSLTSSSGLFSFAYWKALDNLKKRFIVAGTSGGFGQRSINYSNLLMPDQYNPLDPFKPLEVTSYPVKTNYIYADLNLGAKYYVALTKRKFWQAGISYNHINRPASSFLFSNEPDRIFRKLVLHTGGKFPIKGTKVDLIPSGMLAFQSQSYEFNAGSFVRFLVSNPLMTNELTAFSMGVWMRQTRAAKSIAYVDAVNFVMKLEYNQMALGLSYDINLSGARTTTQLKGGPELSLNYTGAMGGTLGKEKLPPCPVF